MHPFHRASFFGLFLVVGSIQSMAFADDAKDRPREVNLKALLDDPERPPTNGVQLKTPKAEIVERVVGHGLRVHWEIHYSGKRWPLVIQTPDLDGPTYGATKLTLYAQGKSGKNFSWTWESPADPTGNARLAKEAFATVDKKARKVDDDIEVDIQPAKQAFLKYFPKEFDEKVPPVMYARLEHWPTDRGVHVDLDAWTGPLIGAVTKVAIKEW